MGADSTATTPITGATTRGLDAVTTMRARGVRAADGDEPVLGRYRLLRQLGAGGFGVVWRARDQTLDREVAVKVVTVADDNRDRDRAEREARAAARLNHPAIVVLYELAGDEDCVYLVSELVRGASLARLIHRGEMSDRRLARIGAVLCDALVHAHGHGVIHRDIKPLNVIIPDEPQSGAGVAKLTDFGVAHLVDDDPLTHTGDVVGTLAYMAPEQARGREATEQADIYSLALTLYEGFTGENPVRGHGPAATARRVGRPLPRLRGKRRDLPSSLCKTIDLCLDPRPSHRPALAELREELVGRATRLADEDGVVAPPRLERARPPRAGVRRVAGRLAADAADELPGAPRLGELSAARPALGVSARLMAALCAGAVALGSLWWLGHTGVPAALAAGVLGATVFALPRLAWLAWLIAAAAWLALAEGRAGLGLVVLAALVPTALLLPRAGPFWCWPVAAPLLGAVGLAPAFAALAGLQAGAIRRVGLALAGYLWLAAAELVTGRSLVLGPARAQAPAPPGDAAGTAALSPAPAADVVAADPSRWETSPVAAVSDALWPVLASGRLAPALAWALLALALPLLVGGRSLALDLAGAAAWAGSLTALCALLASAPAPALDLATVEATLPGAVVGALGAVMTRLARRAGRP